MGLQRVSQQYVSVSYPVVCQKTPSKTTKTADRVRDLSAYSCVNPCPW